MIKKESVFHCYNCGEKVARAKSDIDPNEDSFIEEFLESLQGLEESEFIYCKACGLRFQEFDLACPDFWFFQELGE